MKPKLIIQVLLLTFLPFYITWADTASSPSKNEATILRKLRLNCEFEFGKPFTETDEFAIQQDTSGDYTVHETKTNFQYSVALLMGYPLASYTNRALSFETGIGYHFPQTIQIPSLGISFQEDYLKFPLTLHILQTYNQSFFLAQSMILGYELQINLRSIYKQAGSYPSLDASMLGNPNIKSKIPDFSSLSGNIVFGTRLDFSKGIYLSIYATLPIEIFKIMFGHFTQQPTKLNSYFVDIMRNQSKSFLNFHVGINIMDWLVPKSPCQSSNHQDI